MPNRRLLIDPRELRLPGSRQDGVDPMKLHRQAALHGSSTRGMPAIECKESLDGFFQIYNGVTRAYRIAWLSPGTLVEIEVSGTILDNVASRLKIGDLIP